MTKQNKKSCRVIYYLISYCFQCLKNSLYKTPQSFRSLRCFAALNRLFFVSVFTGALISLGFMHDGFENSSAPKYIVISSQPVKLAVFAS